VQDANVASFEFALVLPHPPVLLPEVGGADAGVVVRTREAMARAAAALREAAPDVVFLAGPHAPAFGETFCVYEGQQLVGTFAEFGAREARLMVQGAPDSVNRLIEEAEGAGLRVSPTRGVIDHGTLVPLWFLLGPPGPTWDEPPAVAAAGASWASLDRHVELGRVISRAAAGTHAAFICSGDLSHRLTPDAPYGYTPRAAEFDALVLDVLRSGKLSDLERIPTDLAEEAGNCGLRPLCVLAGALGDGVSGEVLSYEGPFGVGYPVVLFARQHLGGERAVADG